MCARDDVLNTFFAFVKEDFNVIGDPPFHVHVSRINSTFVIEIASLVMNGKDDYLFCSLSVNL